MLNTDTLRKVSANHQEPAWLLELRLAAFKKFESLPVPSLRYGKAIQTDASSLDIAAIDPLKGVGNAAQVRAPLPIPAPAEGASVCSFAHAFKDPIMENIIRKHLGSAALPSEDKFSALHSAFFNHGILIHTKRNARVEAPIILGRDQAIQNNVIQNNIIHTLVVADAGSTVTIIDQSSDDTGDYAGCARDAFQQGTQGFCSTIVEIIAYEGAQVNYVYVQNLSKNTHHLATKKAIVGKDASVFWIDCIMGSKFTRSTTASTLTAPGAATKNWGFFFGKEDQNFDLNSVTIHSAPHTSSQMLTKGVLDDKAKTVYRGLIRIDEGAHHSDGCQKEETLLISDNAEVDAVPNLEIKNDDVKCSHGAAIGQVDAEKLFYMMARGLDEETAKAKIIEGFFEPMIEQINNTSVGNHIRACIAQRLSNFLSNNRAQYLLVEPLLD
ncbi:Fe-S cluster assembly protein SufD [Candidatus Woesearchaeota archaeon]|nr:Fe-S cluster assembly protein SufD [Candidatus Woesearchaeota archaeon]